MFHHASHSKSSTGSKKKNKGLLTHMKRYDMFGRSVPSFNIKGDETLKTNLGAALTMILLAIVLLYSSVKFIELESRNNPNISSYYEAYLPTKEDAISLNNLNVRFAISFENYRTKDFKHDTRYVRWIFRIFGHAGGEKYEKILPHRNCTATDYE